MTKCLWFASLTVIAVSFAACADERPGDLFPASVAEAAARDWQKALAAGDAAALVKAAGAPFRFKNRTWPTVELVNENLAKEAVRIMMQAKGCDQVEALCLWDLQEGRFPRGAEFAPEKRAAEISRLGVRANGWVVRVFPAGLAGYVIVLNAEGTDRLAVTGIDI